MPPSSNRPAAAASEPSEPPNTSATTTTILRVKRRRDEPPCLPETLLLRTELLQQQGHRGAGAGAGGGADDDRGHRSKKRSRRSAAAAASDRARDEQLADLLQGSAFGMGQETANGSASGCGGKHPAALAKAAATGSGGSAAARFRRVPGGDLSSLAAASSEGEGEAGRRTCKRVRVVDAQIHREPADGDGNRHGNVDDAAAMGRDRSASDASGGGGRRRCNKRARLVLDIVTARDVNGKDCDSDKLVNAGVEFWNSVASATANEEAAGAATATTSSSNKRLIMDPATRAVDTSLREVFHHEKTVLQHLTYLRTDPLLLSVAQPPPQPPPPPPSVASRSTAAVGGGGGGKWMMWLNHRGSTSQNNTGTILHAAAIFNDVDGARLALELGIDATVVDGDDHTALAVAETVGSTGVITLLQSSALGGHGHGDGHGHGALEDEDDDADYVFDVYCLAGAKESARERDDWDNWMSPADRDRARATSGDRRDPNEHHSEEVVDGEGVTKRSSSSTSVEDDARGNHEGNTTSLRKSSSPDTSGSDDNNSSSSDADECRVEIKGGIGFWNERGELVLEAQHSGGATNGNNDDDSYGEGDDHDSNDEAYEGNDYPEDEDDAMESDDENGGGVRTSYGFGMGTSSGAEPYSSDEEGLALYGRSYRHDPIPAPTTSGWSNIWSETTQMGDDSDDDRGHALSGFNMDDSDVGDDDEYEGPLGGSGMLGGSRQVTYGEVGLYGEGGACAYDPEYDDAE